MTRFTVAMYDTGDGAISIFRMDAEDRDEVENYVRDEFFETDMERENVFFIVYAEYEIEDMKQFKEKWKERL